EYNFRWMMRVCSTLLTLKIRTTPFEPLWVIHNVHAQNRSLVLSDPLSIGSILKEFKLLESLEIDAWVLLGAYNAPESSKNLPDSLSDLTISLNHVKRIPFVNDFVSQWSPKMIFQRLMPDLKG